MAKTKSLRNKPKPVKEWREMLFFVEESPDLYRKTQMDIQKFVALKHELKNVIAVTEWSPL